MAKAKTKKVTAEKAAEIVNALSSEAEFGIKFLKANGEEREYEKCRVHYFDEASAGEKKTDRTGVTAKDHAARGNLMMWVPERGYRVAKIANIKQVIVEGVTYEVK